MQWQEYELSRIASVVGGGTPKRERGEYWAGDIAWVTPTDLPPIGASIVEISETKDRITEEGLNSSSARLVPAGTVLLSTRATIGKVAIAAVPLCTNQGFANLIPKPCIDSRFLAYALQFNVEALSALAGSTTFKEVPKSALKTFRVPVPPLSEQRRIVEILDQADHLRRLRAGVNTKADRILPALFLRMFGDPATNPMGWPMRSLSETVESLEAGWSAKGEARIRGDGEYGVLKVSAVTSRVFRPDEHKAVSATIIDRPLVTPRRGDLLFSRANTRELVAATCVVDADEPKLFLPDKLWRVNVRPTKATAFFLHELLGAPTFRETLRARATGTSGSMLNVPQDVFLATLAPIPPVELQRAFSETASKLLDSRRQELAVHDQLVRLWRCLVNRAFSGDLTASWRKGHMGELVGEVKTQAKALAEAE